MNSPKLGKGLKLDAVPRYYFLPARDGDAAIAVIDCRKRSCSCRPIAETFNWQVSDWAVRRCLE